MLIKFLSYLGFTFAPLLLHSYYKRKLLSIKENKGNTSSYNYMCIFITPANAYCRQHIFKKNPCRNTCSSNYLQFMVNFINAATESISICVYLLTLQEISEALCNAHMNGVLVRYIGDQEMSTCTGSQINKLKLNGIRTKVQKREGSMMHHKFCLVDEKSEHGKMCIGTLNLTLQGITSNWDDIVFTNNKEMLLSFSMEFEEMWGSFPDYQRIETSQRN